MNTAANQLLDKAAREAPTSMIEAAAGALRASKDPLRGALLARSLSALTRWVQVLDSRAISDAVGAASDLETLIRMLQDAVSADSRLRKEDALLPARLRGLLAREQLLQAEGGPFSVSEAARALGISPQALNKRRQKGHVLALNTGRHGYLYPSWQFTQTGTLADLERVLAVLRVESPWTQLAFFLNGSSYLDGERPLDELRRGHTDAVLRAAEAYGEHGAA